MSYRIQGDMNGWIDFSDPLDDTLTYNASGLAEMTRLKGGSIWGGYPTPWEKFVFAVEVGQRYLMENTTLGIPALIQSEGVKNSAIYFRGKKIKGCFAQVFMVSQIMERRSRLRSDLPHRSTRTYFLELPHL